MIRSIRKSPQLFLWLVVLQITCISPVQAKVLFHARFDAATADAEYALGKNDARPVLVNTYKVTGTSDAGHCPHFAPRAKRVIQLFMPGGQLEASWYPRDPNGHLR